LQVSAEAPFDLCEDGEWRRHEVKWPNVAAYTSEGEYLLAYLCSQALLTYEV